MASQAIANSYGLVFSISPAKPRPKSKASAEDDEEYVLTLAPFTKPPKINFGSVKANIEIERNVLIINPQEFPVVLKVTNEELNLKDTIDINKLTNVDFKIRWKPEAPGDYKYTILFEVTNTARLKFIVHAYGVCPRPAVVAKPRKPMVMLQPLKREKSHKFTEEARNVNDKTSIISTGRAKLPANVNVFKPVVGNKENVANKVHFLKPKPAAGPTSGAGGILYVAKPLPRMTNTIITTTTISASTKNPTTQIKPEFLSKDRVKAKKMEEWSRDFYKIDDNDDDGDEEAQGGDNAADAQFDETNGDADVLFGYIYIYIYVY